MFDVDVWFSLVVENRLDGLVVEDRGLVRVDDIMDGEFWWVLCC